MEVTEEEEEEEEVVLWWWRGGKGLGELGEGESERLGESRWTERDISTVEGYCPIEEEYTS